MKQCPSAFRSDDEETSVLGQVKKGKSQKGETMKQSEFIERVLQFEACPTCYVRGAFGAVASDSNKKRYKNSLNLTRFKKIDATPSNGFFTDCSGLSKGIFWGWTGDTSKVYGGAVYKSNGVPDYNDASLLTMLRDVSTDFSHIVPGESVWMKGHVGIYVGDGVVVESSSDFDCCVQKTGLGNTGHTINGKSRKWTKHGKFPWVEYEEEPIHIGYTRSDFRRDVRTILGVDTDEQAFNKTITISTTKNRFDALVTPLERYFRELGYYNGEIEADFGKKPCYGRGMSEACKTYQRLIVGSTGKNVDGELTARAQTWRKLLLG